MAVSLLPNWLHVGLTFLLLPGEFYSFLSSRLVQFEHFILLARVRDELSDRSFSPQLFTFIPIYCLPCSKVQVSFAQLPTVSM